MLLTPGTMAHSSSWAAIFLLVALSVGTTYAGKCSSSDMQCPHTFALFLSILVSVTIVNGVSSLCDVQQLKLLGTKSPRFFIMRLALLARAPFSCTYSSVWLENLSFSQAT